MSQTQGPVSDDGLWRWDGQSWKPNYEGRPKPEGLDWARQTFGETGPASKPTPRSSGSDAGPGSLYVPEDGARPHAVRVPRNTEQVEVEFFKTKTLAPLKPWRIGLYTLLAMPMLSVAVVALVAALAAYLPWISSATSPGLSSTIYVPVDTAAFYNSSVKESSFWTAAGVIALAYLLYATGLAVLYLLCDLAHAISGALVVALSMLAFFFLPAELFPDAVIRADLAALNPAPYLASLVLAVVFAMAWTSGYGRRGSRQAR